MFDIEKQPPLKLNPTFEVEVASALMFNPAKVVVPLLEILNGVNDDVVANVVGEPVAM